MLTPRPYQQDAHDAAMAWVRHTTSPCLIEAATASGKSVIVSMLAKSLHDISKGKRVLCLAPSSDLTSQNVEKYRAYGYECSVYSASIDKSLVHPVVFATEGTFKSVVHEVAGEFCAIIIDEAHYLTPTFKNIAAVMREANPNLRIIGLTATPFRLGDGYIFEINEAGNPVGEERAKDPFFKKLVYRITAPYLIEQGFLTPPRVGIIQAEKYDVSALEINRGKFTVESIDKAFCGKGRETAAAVADIVAQSQGRRGVMLFAASMRHAQEIIESLPSSMSRVIGGDINTKRGERRRLVKAFKAQKFKYLVSVGMMTTGVDFPHVDVVAILRDTESVSLLQQIIGRGLRLYEGKTECLILDYVGVIDKHCPDGDLFAPEIKAAYSGSGNGSVSAYCPDCGCTNTFSARPNPDQLQVDSEGYFLDLQGYRVTVPIYDDDGNEHQKPLAAHFGRRCQGQVKSGTEYEQCSHYYESKKCFHCGSDNDIAARLCSKCKQELINPNAKLLMKIADPTIKQTEKVLLMDFKHTDKRIKIIAITTPRRSFEVVVVDQDQRSWMQKHHDWVKWQTAGFTKAPETVTYKMDSKGRYHIKGFNEEIDV